MSGLFIGIDIGGTGSRWVSVDIEGREVARGTAGGANGHLFSAAGRARFDEAIGAIGGATGRPASAVMAGVTGLGEAARPAAVSMLAQAFGIDETSVRAMDDVTLAYRAVFAPGDGHLVSAGTGSIGLHLGRDGEVVRVGGRGMLIDDGGSGAWIVLTALDRLYRRIDETGGVGDADRLSRALHAAMGGSGWEAVRAFVYGADRGAIAALAVVVAEAAADGDPMADGVLADAARELARLGLALLARCGPRPVAFVGGIVGLGPVAGRVRDAMPDAEVTFPRIDAAACAARLAREMR